MLSSLILSLSVVSYSTGGACVDLDGTAARSHVERFVDSGVDNHTLGLVYGRRRIGKSTMLDSLVSERHGFYWEATRTEPAVQLSRLGLALGEHLGVGALALRTWDEAITALLRLGERQAIPVVIDEFGHVIEADPSVPSIIATALGPTGKRQSPGRARLIVCGSAIAIMQALTAGEAPLRGRAGIEVVMQPSDLRGARAWLPIEASLSLAANVYAVIGGVVGYATDMVDHDLPATPEDFDAWVCRRVLSPAATLHHEATTLLAEDPGFSAVNPALYHAILGAIANGSVTAGKIANQLGRAVSNLDPALKRLIAAGFVIRHADPIRAQRPTYALTDPFLQFHYAVLEPSRSLLRDRNAASAWSTRLKATFDSRVKGPVFEEQARVWLRRYADQSLFSLPLDHVGPSNVVIDGKERQLDIVAASTDDPEQPPAERPVVALGEAKAGETVGLSHLDRLEKARTVLGPRATDATLLLFAPRFNTKLTLAAAERGDVELIDLERMYEGS